MSSVVEAFTPVNGWTGPNTVALAPAGSTTNAALPAPAKCAQVFNNASGVMWIAFGNSSVAAVAATPGSPSASMPIPPGACLVVEIPTNATFVAALGTGTIYITPGEGL